LKKIGKYNTRKHPGWKDRIQPSVEGRGGGYAWKWWFNDNTDGKKKVEKIQ
jgi:hypothetical protein